VVVALGVVLELPQPTRLSVIVATSVASTNSENSFFTCHPSFRVGRKQPWRYLAIQANLENLANRWRRSS
jgi:hypothetical protein